METIGYLILLIHNGEEMWGEIQYTIYENSVGAWWKFSDWSLGFPWYCIALVEGSV